MSATATMTMSAAATRAGAAFSAPKKAPTAAGARRALPAMWSTKKNASPLGRRSTAAPRAASSDASETSDLESAARGMGYDTSEGLFGFTPFAELWVGRLAMSGFAVGLAEELFTGEGILAQIGIDTPNPTLTAVLALFFVGGSAVGAAQTLAKAQNGEMTYLQFKRYVGFFGADTDKVASQLSIDVKKMEARSRYGILGPDDMSAINAAKDDNPADRMLSMDDKVAAAAKAAQANKAETASPLVADTMGAPPGSVNADRPLSSSAELAYALDVEMNNGRWAMIGFALAVAIESGTGMGIVKQLFFYAKLSGALGPDSGF